MFHHLTSWRAKLNGWVDDFAASNGTTTMRRPAGLKLFRRGQKHRADHSNPGGVVSDYFRQRNSKVA